MNVYQETRKRLGLTQQELAQEMRVTQGAISALETNRNEASLDYGKRIVLLCRRYGLEMTLDRLYGLEDEQTKAAA